MKATVVIYFSAGISIILLTIALVLFNRVATVAAHPLIAGDELAQIISMTNVMAALLLICGIVVLLTAVYWHAQIRGRKIERQQLRHALGKTVEIEFAETEEHAEIKNAIEQLNTRLAEAKRKELALIERAVAVICIIDLEAKIHSANAASLTSWGYTAAELESLPLSEILVTESKQSLLDTILGASKSINKVVFECKLKRKDGTIIDVIWSGHWSASEGGLYCIVHDITERKRNEDLLRQNEERLRTILNELPVGVLILAPNGDAEFSNIEASLLLRCANNQLESQHVNVQDLFEDDLYSATDIDVLEQDNIKTRAERSDGSYVPVEVRLGNIELSNERKRLLVFSDKTAEHELDKLKNEFTSMVVHDLKAPLSSFLSFIELYEGNDLGQTNEFGNVLSSGVRKEINRVLKLISSLLELSKLKSGLVKLDCRDISMKDAIQQALTSVGPLATRKNLSFDLNSTIDLHCWADEERIVQVLVNFLSNAIKFSPESGVVNIGVAPASEADDVKVTVTDSGRGLAANKIDLIFRKFEQVDKDDGRILGGTGLGLSICKSIIDAHGGEIGAQSEPGKGSSFWFSLPSEDKKA